MFVIKLLRLLYDCRNVGLCVAGVLYKLVSITQPIQCTLPGMNSTPAGTIELLAHMCDLLTELVSLVACHLFRWSRLLPAIY